MNGPSVAGQKRDKELGVWRSAGESLYQKIAWRYGFVSCLKKRRLRKLGLEPCAAADWWPRTTFVVASDWGGCNVSTRGVHQRDEIYMIRESHAGGGTGFVQRRIIDL